MLVGGLDRPSVYAADAATAFVEAIPPLNTAERCELSVSERRKLWVPMDFHPFLLRPVASAFKRVNQDIALRQVISPLFSEFDLRPAWRVTSTPFAGLIRRY